MTFSLRAKALKAALPAAALAALALAPQPAGAQGANHTLNIGLGGSITSVDPHYYNAAPNNALSMHIFDRLVERDARARPYPGLAESWRPISETVWEFKLRPGVKWHDGRDFTAEDVAFTIQRTPNVPNSPGGFGGFVRAITRVEVVDPLTLHLHTARPHPLLPVELGSVAVIAKHVDGTATEDYNSGRAAIGTGPYRFSAYLPGDRTELVRNDAYWGQKEPWERVNYRFIGNDSARTAALLAGDVDLIDQVAASDLAKLRRDQRITVSEIQGLRMIYLASDFSRSENPVYVTDNDGKPLARNPFLDRRVRQALYIAINRQGIVEQVMEGTAAPNGQWLPPGVYSHNPDVPVPAYDPDQAKRLLAEAGFPNGFRMTLHTPNDRYPNDARTAQAVAQMWTRIGVRTTVEAVPWAAYSVRASRQEYGMRLAGWGSSTGEASYTLINIVGTFNREKRTGSTNHGRYSNPELDALTERAVATLDDAQRETLLRQAVKMTMDDLPIMPIHQLVNVWALRRGLTFDPRMDERTVAMGVRPAAH
jgi:peptide/nickel transport system substrate-binding protein